jgi:hypothetical protein
MQSIHCRLNSRLQNSHLPIHLHQASPKRQGERLATLSPQLPPALTLMPIHANTRLPAESPLTGSAASN